MPLRRRLLIAVTSAYLVALAVVGLWPQHVDEGIDVVGWPPVKAVIDAIGLDRDVAYAVLENGANLLWFVPFGVLVGTITRRRALPSAVVAGLLTSSAIELAQLVFRPERTASVADVVTNTVGTVVGAAIGALVSRRRSSPAATDLEADIAATDG